MNKPPVRRGVELREQLLFAAKNEFLAAGFERTSMDRVAARAGTTKRTLYAHFGRKEDLFLAVFELVLGLQLHHLGQPADYAPTPAPALTGFCRRFLETMLSSRPLSLFRLAIAEAGRFGPGGTVRLHEALLESAEAQLAQFLATVGPPELADRAARQLLAGLLYPRFTRALLGASEPAATHSEEMGDTPAVDPAFVDSLVVAALLAVTSSPPTR